MNTDSKWERHIQQRAWERARNEAQRVGLNIEASQVYLGINAALDEVINDGLRADMERIREMEREAHKDADRVIGGVADADN